MDSSNVITDINSSSELNLDGTELYGEDGQTVSDITELDNKEKLEILDIKKELPKQP